MNSKQIVPSPKLAQFSHILWPNLIKILPRVKVLHKIVPKRQCVLCIDQTWSKFLTKYPFISRGRYMTTLCYKNENIRIKFLKEFFYWHSKASPAMTNITGHDSLLWSLVTFSITTLGNKPIKTFSFALCFFHVSHVRRQHIFKSVKMRVGERARVNITLLPFASIKRSK